MKGMAEIGLRTNLSKTFVTGHRAQELAEHLGCEARPRGVKILGPWITPHASPTAKESTDEYLQSKLSKHGPFFRDVPLLPQDVAFTLLRFCGVPRWNYFIRTHDPELAADAHRTFDCMVAECFKLITNIDPANCTDEQRQDLITPMKEGGVGLQSAAMTAEQIYAASKDPAGGDQESRLKKLRDEWFEKLPQSAKKIRRDNKSHGASTWMQDVSTPTQAYIFNTGIAHRLRYSTIPAVSCEGCHQVNEGYRSRPRLHEG